MNVNPSESQEGNGGDINLTFLPSRRAHCTEATAGLGEHVEHESQNQGKKVKISRYTKTKTLNMSLRMPLTTDWKTARALVSPNGITKYS